MQCGEFYETIGLDAVVVMQYASLNPMGKKWPQAGAPLGNIRQLLTDLVQGAGFSVVSLPRCKFARGLRLDEFHATEMAIEDKAGYNLKSCRS